VLHLFRGDAPMRCACAPLRGRPGLNPLFVAWSVRFDCLRVSRNRLLRPVFSQAAMGAWRNSLFSTD